MKNKTPFTFNISLSVLNHLGRSLYRSFTTVLGEAISNSWDADAKNVYIEVDKAGNSFSIKDDGTGMTANDFQSRFLKIGYSKRKDGAKKTSSGRPFIGRKGIGKLALLSCAEKITVLSKVKGGFYVGGIIDNPSLDNAITDDLTPQEYQLGRLDLSKFSEVTLNHLQGTIIYFDGIKQGIRNSFEFLAKTIALYFRFSLLDPNFRIFLDGKEITHVYLHELAEKTEFLWKIGNYSDPYIEALEHGFAGDPYDHESRELTLLDATGFVASVEKPRNLKIMATEERIGVDLFVNGRLRERDVLKHIPTARVAESYLYGQIHFNGLDDATDRFTSSREGIVADDPKYATFLDRFRKTINTIIDDWDKWRLKHREEGDPDNERLSGKERASRGLYGAVSNEYGLSKGAKNRGKVAGWVSSLSDDAAFNFESYADCFISENLVREYIHEKKVPLSKEAKREARQWKDRETASMGKGNISIQVRKNPRDTSYLSMDGLANLVDGGNPQKEACLARDANEYKPIRDAVAHTARLTDEAKKKLSTVRENIKGRVKTILSNAYKEDH